MKTINCGGGLGTSPCLTGSVGPRKQVRLLRARCVRRKKPAVAFLLMLFAGFAGASSQAQVLVIANPSIKAPDISRSDLRSLFTGTSSALAGARAAPILLKQGPVTTDFLMAYVGKNDTAFLISWRSLVFSGQATMPRTLDTDAAMVEFVSTHPGAVGYISRSTPHEGVKVLPVK